jgi:CubicO group peptidase (beta-lactamase class C family)
MADVGTPGASMAIWHDGALVTTRGYGVKRRGQNDPVTPQTIFRIGSITKMMTAAAVLQQVEAGTVDLAAPITDLIPEFALKAPWAAETLTSHHLLTHTTGFPDRLSDIEGRTDEQALTDWAAQQSVTELHAPPGAFWNYSNPNFMLAGLVAERGSGTPYHRYMAEQVWLPAGMPSTSLTPAEAMADGDWSYGHYTNPQSGTEVILAPDAYDHWAAAPAGWAFSTATDLVRWAALLMDGGGGVLSESSVELMIAPHEPTRYAASEHYGYGVMTDQYNGVEVKFHGGNLTGWGAFLLWVPSEDFAVAVLANTFESLPQATYCIADVHLGLETVDPPDEGTDPATWSGYAGAYSGFDVLGRQWRAEVVPHAQGATFVLIPEWSPDEMLETELVQVYEHTFVVDLDHNGSYDADFTFVLNETSGRSEWIRSRQLVLERQQNARGDALR